MPAAEPRFVLATVGVLFAVVDREELCHWPFGSTCGALSAARDFAAKVNAEGLFAVTMPSYPLVPGDEVVILSEAPLDASPEPPPYVFEDVDDDRVTVKASYDPNRPHIMTTPGGVILESEDEARLVAAAVLVHAGLDPREPVLDNLLRLNAYRDRSVTP